MKLEIVEGVDGCSRVWGRVAAGLVFGASAKASEFFYPENSLWVVLSSHDTQEAATAALRALRD